MVRSASPQVLAQSPKNILMTRKRRSKPARLTEWLALKVAVPYFAEITPRRARVFCPSAPPTNSKTRFAAPCGAPTVTTPRSLKNLYLLFCTASGRRGAIDADGMALGYADTDCGNKARNSEQQIGLTFPSNVLTRMDKVIRWAINQNGDNTIELISHKTL